MNKKALLAAILVLMIIIALTSIRIITDWKKLDTERITEMQLSTIIYDNESNEVFRIDGGIDRIFVSLNELPRYVADAFIAAEDLRFYEHEGIDFRRILGATIANIKSGSYSQGASTITQQLIKLTHLSNEKTISRKLQEAYLSIQLENRWSKDEILEAYINTVYFGGGAYGIEAAAERYFSKNASELTIGEAAMLAGIIKSPSSYAPHIDMNASLNRRRYVLESMKNAGYITEEEFLNAESTAIIIDDKKNPDNGTWYGDLVSMEACDVLGIDLEDLMAGGYSVYTGFNTDYQKTADGLMNSSAIYPDKNAESALVVITPESGEIAAVIGGREYQSRYCFNRAISARRQPGSLIKPISTYAAAVDKHDYFPTTIVHDVQRVFPDGYSPGNSSGIFYGEITMRTALAKSLNAATVDLADTLGLESVIKYLNGFGIKPVAEDKNLALALGAMTHGVTPLEMCAAYATLANNGVYIEPHCIRKIIDRGGNVVYECDPTKNCVVSEESAYIINDILKTAAESGTAKALKALQFPVAAKTGTSGLDNGDTADAWTAAYTPEIALVVWFGRDNNAGGGMPGNISGGGSAAPVCAEFLKRISEDLDAADFVIPDSLTRMLIDSYALDSQKRVLSVSANTPNEYISNEIFPNDIKIPMSDIWEVPSPVYDLEIISKPGEVPRLRFTGSGLYSDYMIIRQCADESKVVGIIECNIGEAAVFEDIDVELSKTNIYSVIPRHKILYELGTVVMGPESNKAVYSPPGVMNGFASLFERQTDHPDIDAITKPLF